jgi:small subunit ribosomal protein S18
MVDLPDEVRDMETKPQEAVREEHRPRGPQRERSDRGDRGGGGRFGGPARRHRRLFWSGKVCVCCVKKLKYIDYKEIDVLRRFVSGEGKILPRRLSGACSHHQRMLTTAIKRARNIGLLPFSATR